MAPRETAGLTRRAAWYWVTSLQNLPDSNQGKRCSAWSSAHHGPTGDTVGGFPWALPLPPGVSLHFLRHKGKGDNYIYRKGRGTGTSRAGGHGRQGLWVWCQEAHATGLPRAGHYLHISEHRFFILSPLCGLILQMMQLGGRERSGDPRSQAATSRKTISSVPAPLGPELTGGPGQGTSFLLRKDFSMR